MLALTIRSPFVISDEALLQVATAGVLALAAIALVAYVATRIRARRQPGKASPAAPVRPRHDLGDHPSPDDDGWVAERADNGSPETALRP